MTSSKRIELDKVFFEEGIPGFTHLQFFQVLQEEMDSPFVILQSMEDEEVGFWVIDTFSLFPDYDFTLTPQAKASLRLEEHTPLAVVNIVTLRAEHQLTVNLKAPIIINKEKRIAKQVILVDDRYDIRHPLFKPGPKWPVSR